METTVKSVDYTYNKIELEKKIDNLIDLIEDWCKKNDYRIIGTLTNEIPNFYKISKTKLKKINKYIIGLEKHMTMRKINSFFHLLTKIGSSNPVRIQYSEREMKIQETRKQMLKAKDIYESLLKNYKEEKGNYYKIK